MATTTPTLATRDDETRNGKSTGTTGYGALAPADAARYLGVGYSTLKKWRSEGTGPRYAKIGGCILYRPRDLEAFLEAQLVA
ncbi:helix-turn-helix domain-containing protein [Leucobacter sp. M11]|uniref:helix-turn-helix domain-containing protein n=1 Tax=Leucobacter sp. M11 TaxID=2993565 RepID=UPI002D7EEE0A|nr:helix-turn-helix domain-containing protein [Leucobacter sp. M11]MEB4613274.1 helix-turn-helix domain-containing protein [Leucobacter sp. M11]